MAAIRTGLLGSWDRVVGPGATAVENAGTLGLGVAGALLGAASRRSTASAWSGPVLRLMAADLWGGAWCNNTPAAARWYHRPGQGPRQHLLFAAAHLHPFVLALIDRRDRGRWTWATCHYGHLMVTTAVITRAGGRGKHRLGLLGTLGGLLLDRRLGPSPSARWFAAVYHLKLLAGHAAGSALLPAGRREISASPARRPDGGDDRPTRRAEPTATTSRGPTRDLPPDVGR